MIKFIVVFKASFKFVKHIITFFALYITFTNYVFNQLINIFIEIIN